MAAPHDQREPVAGKRLADDAGRQWRGRGRETEIDLPLLHPAHDVATDRLEPQIDAGRLDLEPRDQPRAEEDGVRVAPRQAYRAPEPRRIEVLGAEQPAELVQRRPDLRREALRERRRREAAARADQQRIAERLAQARQRAAHRRLAEADVGGGMRDVPAPQKRLERRQQIEVEPG